MRVGGRIYFDDIQIYPINFSLTLIGGWVGGRYNKETKDRLHKKFCSISIENRHFS